MKLIKDGYIFNTTDEVVIKAYKLNGFEETEEKAVTVEEPVKPLKKTTKK